SSDSDFMPMAMRIRQDGLPVYGFGSAKTPDAFKQACTRFIDVDALIRAEKDGNAKGEKGKVDEDVVALLIDAYDAAKRDENGYAALSAVGQRAGNRSSFDVRNYGYSRLRDLIEDIPNFATEQRENGQVWVKRLR
ncbi:MAG: OST-HTH/LOTUS domain-containing protein, partial [Parasphingopyxis sp.]|uniref:OST-HTH/LOTUS domain-containing protein n=1 Tax=Parasphingopyxis sp. TaxID=1920299 RepID=UPI003F9ECAB5